MNNFQLNNTSVYLGGQCKWDIVIDDYKGQLYVSGFQLSPLSDNIPFNKRGTVTHLNDNHSYTLKKYCESLKEDFWSTTPYLNRKINIQDSETASHVGYYDNSFIAGVKRSDCYGVYNKQFECLVPLWLEKIDKGNYLKFIFRVYSTNKSALDYKLFELKPLDNISVFEFHNKFVTYFYNWLNDLHIIEDSDSKGNNKVINIDLPNRIAQIDGVSTISGQKTNLISCDYVCDNLLSYERPNVEFDYILNSLFRSHNIVTSQLFNLNFCFNLYDIIDPFLINQLNGKQMNIECETYVENNKLDVRSLFTNYSFIKKPVSDPYVFLDNTEVGNTGEIAIEYKVNYKSVSGSEIDVNNLNVLDYLYDYKNKDVCDVNKLSQYINHWDFIEHKEEIFNLYGGYAGMTTCIDGIPTPTGSTDSPKYDLTLYDILRSNGIDPTCTDAYVTKNNGALNWIYPAKILCVNNSDKFNDIVIQYVTSDDSILYNEGLWTLDKSAFNSNKYEEELKKLKTIGLNFIYTDNINDINNLINGNINFYEIYQYQDDNIVYIYGIRKENNKKNNHYVILSDDMKWFSVDKLYSLYSELKDSNFKDLINTIHTINKDNADKCDFYSFGTEILVGLDKLNDYCYYKSKNKKTFLYRKCGSITPCLITDPKYNINYFYYQDSIDKSINKYEYDSSSTQKDFEYRVYGESVIINIMGELQFDIEKSDTDQNISVESLIKEKLKSIYSITDSDDLVDYIYGLYNITFTFDYKSETDISITKYSINMILK